MFKYSESHQPFRFRRIAHNVHGLLLCWDLIMSSPGPKPSEKLMMKLTTNAQKNSVCPILADSFTKADCYSVCQHSGKPNVAGSAIFSIFVL